MAYQYGPCSKRKVTRETVYIADDIRISQTAAGSHGWQVETYQEFAGIWHLVSLKPESYYDALKRGEYVRDN